MNVGNIITADSNAEQNFIMSISRQYQGDFRVVCTDMGETVYEWMDMQAKNLSSMRLARFLRWAEGEGVNSPFIAVVKQELVDRGHYPASCEWRF